MNNLEQFPSIYPEAQPETEPTPLELVALRSLRLNQWRQETAAEGVETNV